MVIRWPYSIIDPTYTLGDMARRRRGNIETVGRKRRPYLNKELELLSSLSGLLSFHRPRQQVMEIFCNQLNIIRMALYSIRVFSGRHAGWQGGRRQSLRLSIPSMRGVMIGMVVIIGGGGATSDLSGYATTWRQIARSFRCLSLPASVMNATILILASVSHTCDVKTPTAAAGFSSTICAARLKTLEDYVRPFFMRSLPGWRGKRQDSPAWWNVYRCKPDTLTRRTLSARERVIRQMEDQFAIPDLMRESHRLGIGWETIGQSVLPSDGRESSSPVPGATDKGSLAEHLLKRSLQHYP